MSRRVCVHRAYVSMGGVQEGVCVQVVCSYYVDCKLDATRSLKNNDI